MIVHICQASAWVDAQKTGEYRPSSLDTESFIHASLPEQVLRVANRFYAGKNDLLLLWIDPQRVRAPIRYELADDEQFPHIYGALDLVAVRAVSAFPPDDDGIFRQLPSISDRNSLS